MTGPDPVGETGPETLNPPRDAPVHPPATPRHTPPGPGGHPTMALVLAGLDPEALRALRHVDTVTDETRRVLYLNCRHPTALTERRVRRIVVAAYPSGCFDIEDQDVTTFPWRVEVTATRIGVDRLHLNAKLRELGRRSPGGDT